LLHTDAGPRQVRCYHLTANGAGYDVDREDLVTSTDNWFRPSDVCVAPDGSVFVADWYDPGVGGHGMGDTKRGRLLRPGPQGEEGERAEGGFGDGEGAFCCFGIAKSGNPLYGNGLHHESNRGERREERSRHYNGS